MGVLGKFKGSCYCQNIEAVIELSRSPESYNPRACDCNFCRKQGASYISDPEGSFKLHVKDMTLLSRFHQDADPIVDFLHCKNCGVFVGAVHHEADTLYGAVNSAIADREIQFGEKMVVSPKSISDEEKIERWKQIWFSNVQILEK